jgi:hypothetical protein
VLTRQSLLFTPSQATHGEAAAKLAHAQSSVAKYKSTIKAQEQVIAKLEEMLAKNLGAKGAVLEP